MNIFKSKAFFVTVIVLLVGAIAVMVMQRGRHSELNIGILVPLTGGAASYGENARKGAELALQQFRHEHPDIKVKFVIEDSRGEASVGLKAASKLVNLDRVVAIVGDVTSGVTLAIAKLVNEARVVLVSPGASSPNVSEAGPYVFRTWPSDTFEATAIASHLAANGVTDLAVLRINNEYGAAIEQAVRRSIATKVPNLKISLALTFEQGTREMRTQMLQINVSPAKAIYFIGFPEAAVVFGHAYAEAGLTLPIFATSAFEDPQIPEKTGGALNGTVYTKPESESPNAAAFRNEYQRVYGQAPGVVADTAFDATRLVLSAIADINGDGGVVSGNAIQEKFAAVKDYAGVSGVLSFDENGDVVKPIGLYVLREGKYEKLAK